MVIDFISTNGVFLERVTGRNGRVQSIKLIDSPSELQRVIRLIDRGMVELIAPSVYRLKNLENAA